VRVARWRLYPQIQTVVSTGAGSISSLGHAAAATMEQDERAQQRGVAVRLELQRERKIDVTVSNLGL
jgi:hypothetical protein